MTRKLLFAISVSLSVFFPHRLLATDVLLDSTETHSIETQENRFSLRQLIVPTAIITLGALGTIDYQGGINHEIQKNFVDKKHFSLDNYLRFVPSAGYLALGGAGIGAKHSFKERCAALVTSHAIMMTLGYGLKAIVQEERPDRSDNHSFPSGHAAFSFTGAELLRIEYGTCYGIVGYAVATSVAFLRIYNNKHWLNDVVMGAGIGILSARLGYALLPWERKLFRWDKMDSSKQAVAVLPQYDFQRKVLGVSVFAQF